MLQLGGLSSGISKPGHRARQQSRSQSDTGNVENGATDMELRVVLAAGAVHEIGTHQIRLDGTGDALLGDTLVVATTEHRVGS